MQNNDSSQAEVCTKCGSGLGEQITTPTGRKLKRCSKGNWDPQTFKTTGCTYIKWYPVEPVTLDEKCPKCQSPLVLAVTRFGKKMKKCSTQGWDKVERKVTGCEFIEWIGGTTEALKEECPECGSPLVLYTTAAGKKMKKCSTSGWDKAERKATGCPYVQWLKKEETLNTDTGEENPPTE